MINIETVEVLELIRGVYINIFGNILLVWTTLRTQNSTQSWSNSVNTKRRSIYEGSLLILSTIMVAIIIKPFIDVSGNSFYCSLNEQSRPSSVGTKAKTKPQDNTKRVKTARKRHQRTDAVTMCINVLIDIVLN